MTQPLTDMSETVLDALDRLGYPHVSVCRINADTFGAAGFRSLREMASAQPGMFVRGSSRAEALWRLLERVG